MDASSRRVTSPAYFPAPTAAVSVAGRYVAADHNAAVSPPPDKRKRGRPRKYFTPGANTAPAAGGAAAASSPLPPAASTAPVRAQAKKAARDAPGGSGQSLTPHVLAVAAGEDATQHILRFVQRQKHAVCILSASGSLSSACLRQPSSGGLNMTYEGRFEILSLSGSFLHTELNGAPSKIGGLSICLSSSDGRMIGGGVGGLLKADGPVQIITGTFPYDDGVKLLEQTDDTMLTARVEKSTPSFGQANPSQGFQSNNDMFATDRDKSDHLSAFLSQSQPMHGMTSHLGNWRENQMDHGALGFPGRNDGEHNRAFRFPGDGNDDDLDDQD